MQKENQISSIKPAHRVNCVTEYYFSRKLKEIAAMNAQGMQIINLGIGSPDLPPSKEVIDTLCESARQHDSHGYQPYVGIAELRNAFASWYQRWYGVTLDPNTEIQPLIGSKEGIMHISMTFLNEGDEVLIPNPGYPTYSSVSKLVGAKSIPYDLTEENNWEPNFEQLESMDLSRVKLMWINYPNMPTGAQATKALFKKLVDFGKKHGIVICNDNPYSFILNETPLSILEVEGARDICIELNSMSKSHNMPGWRMAMLASNKQFIEWILRVKSNVDSGQFKPMQLACVKALNADITWYKEMNSVYKKRRVCAEEIFKTLGCTFDPKQSGLFLWGKIPDHYESAETISEEILHNAKVFITPGFIFGSNGDRFLRISLCCTEEGLQNALYRIIESKK